MWSDRSGMVFVPRGVACRIEGALRSRRGNPYTPKQLARAANEILSRLSKVNSGGLPSQGTSVVAWRDALKSGSEDEGRSLAAAHALLRGPPSFAAASHALTRAFGIDPYLLTHKGRLDPPLENFEEKSSNEESGVRVVRVLDWGAGCGSGSMAAMDVLGAAARRSDSASLPKLELQLDCVEPCDRLRQVGRVVVPEAFWSQRARRRRGQNAGHYDLVLACFSLSELGDDRRFNAAVDDLWQMVRPGGVLAVVEAGNPSGFDSVRRVRDRPWATNPSDSRILAPCPHWGGCPAAEGEGEWWCHFAQPWSAAEPIGSSLSGSRGGGLAPAAHWANYARARRGSALALRRSGGSGQGNHVEKLSYLAVQRRGGESPLSALVGGEAAADREEEEEEGRASRRRVVGSPRRRGGHILLRVCGAGKEPSGEVVVPKSSGDYAEVRQKRWGDLVHLVA